MKVVCWTDGGCRPKNPGTSGWGSHGYLFSKEVEKAKVVKFNDGRRVNNFLVTSKGYVPLERKTEDLVYVVPEFYFDLVGSSSDPTGTNNKAEIQAITDTLKGILSLEHEIESIHIYSDSNITVNMLNKSEGLKNYTGSNPEFFEKCFEQLGLCKEKGISLKIDWIKAHNGHLGNETADRLATIGTNLANAGKDTLDFTMAKASNKYWEPEVDLNPLISFNRCYFNSSRDIDTKGQYYLASVNSKAPEHLLGKRIPETSLSILRLNKEDSILEDVKERQFLEHRGLNNIVSIRLDKLFSKPVFRYVKYYSKNCLLFNYKTRGLDFLDKSPVTTEINPVGLSLRAIEAFKTLENLLDNVENNNDKVVLIDITNHFFKEVKGTKNKKEIVKTVLSDEILIGTKDYFLDVTVDGKEIKLPLVLGTDLPDRNTLKKLEDTDVSVSLVVWSKSDGSFRYCGLIKNNTGIGIWSNYYADRIFLF